MDKLPLELLRCICDNFKDEKSTLKAVRLVNKNFAGAAAPLLFRILLVYQTPKSWKRLGSVAQCGWLAHHVVKLEVAALGYLPHYLNFTDWKLSTWDFRWEDYRDEKNRAGMVLLLVEEQENNLFPPQLPYDPYTQFEDWKQQPEVRKWHDQHEKGSAAYLSSVYREQIGSPNSALESALGLRYWYEKYRYWHDGENRLSDLLHQSKDSQPLSGLIQFPQLRTVAILGSHELGKISDWPYLRTDRKARETKVNTWLQPRIEESQADVGFALTLQMLDVSGVNITRLELHRYQEILTHTKVSVSPLKNLHELIVNLPMCVSWQDAERYQGRWELASWLRRAEGLRNVKITPQDPENRTALQFFDIFALFHSAEWPKLRCLHFEATSVRPRSLLRFLSKHSRSLESVRIKTPVISWEAWQSLTSEFRVLEFRSPGCVVDIDVAGGGYPGTILAEYLEDDRNWIN